MIGNPPFLGGKLLISGLGEQYASRMFAAWKGRVPREADLACYWFVKAGEQVATGKTTLRPGSRRIACVNLKLVSGSTTFSLQAARSFRQGLISIR